MSRYKYPVIPTIVAALLAVLFTFVAGQAIRSTWPVTTTIIGVMEEKDASNDFTLTEHYVEVLSGEGTLVLKAASEYSSIQSNAIQRIESKAQKSDDFPGYEQKLLVRPGDIVSLKNDTGKVTARPVGTVSLTLRDEPSGKFLDIIGIAGIWAFVLVLLVLGYERIIYQGHRAL